MRVGITLVCVCRTIWLLFSAGDHSWLCYYSGDSDWMHEGLDLSRGTISFFFSFLWVIHLGQCWPHTSLRLLLTTRPGCSCHSPEISGHASRLPVFFLHVLEPFSWALQERPHLPWPFREDCFFDPFLFQSNFFPLIINSRICNPRMFPRWQNCPRGN